MRPITIEKRRSAFSVRQRSSDWNSRARLAASSAPRSLSRRST